MVDLQKIRDEHNKRPFIVASPSEIERKFPKREELYADEKQCCVEGCRAPSFRNQLRCKDHHLAWCAEVESQNEKEQAEREKYLISKRGQEKRAKATAQALNIRCSECDKYLRFPERIVVPKGKRPKSPDYPHQIYKVVCSDCK